MIPHSALTPAELRQKIKSSEIMLGGNRRLKIYGTLTCRSGKRMAVAQRVFFASEAEARAYGFRPCGHCLRNKYRKWKANSSAKRNPVSPRNRVSDRLVVRNSTETQCQTKTPPKTRT